MKLTSSSRKALLRVELDSSELPEDPLILPILSGVLLIISAVGLAVSSLTVVTAPAMGLAGAAALVSAIIRLKLKDSVGLPHILSALFRSNYEWLAPTKDLWLTTTKDEDLYRIVNELLAKKELEAHAQTAPIHKETLFQSEREIAVEQLRFIEEQLLSKTGINSEYGVARISEDGLLIGSESRFNVRSIDEGSALTLITDYILGADNFIRCCAISTLGTLGQERVVDSHLVEVFRLLSEVLRDTDPFVRHAAAEALYRIGPIDGQPVDALRYVRDTFPNESAGTIADRLLTKLSKHASN